MVQVEFQKLLEQPQFYKQLRLTAAAGASLKRRFKEGTVKLETQILCLQKVGYQINISIKKP